MAASGGRTLDQRPASRARRRRSDGSSVDRRCELGDGERRCRVDATPRTPGCSVATNGPFGATCRARHESALARATTTSSPLDRDARRRAAAGRGCAASRGARSRPSGDAGRTTTASSRERGRARAAHAAGANPSELGDLDRLDDPAERLGRCREPVPTSSVRPPLDRDLGRGLRPPAGSAPSRTHTTATAARRHRQPDRRRRVAQVLDRLAAGDARHPLEPRLDEGAHQLGAALGRRRGGTQPMALRMKNSRLVEHRVGVAAEPLPVAGAAAQRERAASASRPGGSRTTRRSADHRSSVAAVSARMALDDRPATVRQSVDQRPRLGVADQDSTRSDRRPRLAPPPARRPRDGIEDGPSHSSAARSTVLAPDHGAPAPRHLATQHRQATRGSRSLLR